MPVCLRPCASSPLSDFAFRIASRASGLLLPALLCLLLAPPASWAQEALSPPLSGSISDPIYSESTQNGPSNSLVQGDNSLTNPYLRDGTSDPLGFLVESGTMSPYLLGSNIDNYADSLLQTQIISDAILVARFSEYRENRQLMSGAGSLSLPRGRTAAAGTVASSGAGPRANASSMLAFGGLSMRAQFAAGSSLLANRQTQGGESGFIDPNALLAAANSSTALSGMQGEASGAYVAGTDAQGSDAGASSASGATSLTALASLPIGVFVPPATSTPVGPQSGSLFPDISISGPSATGFMDATMGTAGIMADTQNLGISHAFSPRGDPAESPFRSLNSEGVSYLNPSLRGADPGSMQPHGSGLDVSEVARRARLHAMIYNPGAPLPSAFEQRKMERDYQKRSSGRRPSRYPATTAPSIRP